MVGTQPACNFIVPDRLSGLVSINFRYPKLTVAVGSEICFCQLLIA